MLRADGAEIAVPAGSKETVAEAILDVVESLLH